MSPRPVSASRRPTLVPLRDLGAEVRRCRQRHGLSHAEVAARLGLEEAEVVRAESTRSGTMVRTRKAILERLAGCTLEGPFYRVLPLEPEGS